MILRIARRDITELLRVGRLLGARVVHAGLRLLSLSLGYALYLGIFVGFVLAVSALARSSRIALTVLLGAWIAIAILAPRAIADASRSWFPSESRRDFNAQLDTESGGQYQRAWTAFFGRGFRHAIGMHVPLGHRAADP